MSLYGYEPTLSAQDIDADTEPTICEQCGYSDAVCDSVNDCGGTFGRDLFFANDGVEIELTDDAEIVSLSTGQELTGKDFAQRKHLANYIGFDNSFAFDLGDFVFCVSGEQVTITDGEKRTVKRITGKIERFKKELFSVAA